MPAAGRAARDRQQPSNRTNDTTQTNIMVDDPQSANSGTTDEPDPDPDDAPSSGPDPDAGSAPDPFGDLDPGGTRGSEAEAPFGTDAFEGPDGDGPSFDSSGGPMPDGMGGESAGFAYEMAKMWVRDHQKTAMVGAFATGVFLGALLRD